MLNRLSEVTITRAMRSVDYVTQAQVLVMSKFVKWHIRRARFKKRSP